jgi:HAD superfamily hydrolase (TIGR01490 family)
MSTGTSARMRMTAGAAVSAGTRTSTRSVVFCDVDETLVDSKTMFDFLEYYLAAEYGEAGARCAERIRRELLMKAAQGMPREQANREYYRVWQGEPAAVVKRAAGSWWAARSVYPEFFITPTWAELECHRAAGALIVLVSGSFPAILESIAAAAGATRLLCTRPEISGGWYTGEILGEAMIGEAKRKAVRAVLAEYPFVDPAACFAYGDHISDLPMLAEVGHPVVVGGDDRLRAALPHARVL